MRGEPTEALLRDCQDRVLQIIRDAGRGKVLYDPVDIPLAQRKLDEELRGVHIRRAIVVPNTKLAYLARLAFGDGDYRVFYSDMTAAIAWLGQSD